MSPTPYIGRFAPSPTGPLHLGSLLAALASYLDAKANKGQWLLRIEDIDPPREQAGASRSIIQTLAEHGLEHDGQIQWQSRNTELYLSTLEQLKRDDLIFACQCSRQQLARHQGIHQGVCSHHDVDLLEPGWAWRLNLAQADNSSHFVDHIQGLCQQDLRQQVGDVVLRRKDGLFAYQLAAVCDDIDHGITDVVRGVDLIDSSLRQIYLYQCLNQSPVNYKHIPVIVNAQGQKLSKQNHAAELDCSLATSNLFQCLQLLGQQPPPQLRQSEVTGLLDWGQQHWQLSAIPTKLNSTH